MNIQILGAFAAVALLAACSSSETAKPEPVANPGKGIVPGSQEDLVANVGDRIFFDFDKATVKGTGAKTSANMSTLDKQAAWLAQWKQNNVQIAGNADERGTSEYNIALGAKRATADRDYLVAKGVAATRISTISYGKDRPVALGSNEEAWAQNRNAITSVR
jgi:peptidoglycan-associated lipoprotein